jgi:hypothetical protein
VACSHGPVDPGISREKAEAVLKAFDYTDIVLQADPNGWSGTAVPASDRPARANTIAIGCASMPHLTEYRLGATLCVGATFAPAWER